MTKEDEKLLLKDLGARMIHGVIVNTPKGDGYLGTINLTIFGHELGVNVKATERETFPLDECKPYLRPMSSMTEEEFHDIIIIDNKRGIFSSRHLTLHLDGEVIDYLNSKMFDWRNLISKGLAMEAPEGMYN